MKVRDEDGTYYDSQLEIDYKNYLEDLVSKGIVEFYVYHPKYAIYFTETNRYTPDFVVYYKDKHCEIVETKGYNQFSYQRDLVTHGFMKSKTEEDLKFYLYKNHLPATDYKVVYKKVKYLKAFGFVDWDFKNPNTLANKRKEKLVDAEQEIKDLKKFKRDTLRYFRLIEKKKLTKDQSDFTFNYYSNIIKLLSKDAENE